MKEKANRPLGATAIFAMLWLIARAHVQSVTIDEADTWLAYAGAPFPAYWRPGANNHVLNSMLIRLFTSIFGLWHVTLRAPALIGGAIYVGAAYALATALPEDRRLEWPLFVCLVYNPFVMDYLVAARGYGLALALFLVVLALAVRRPDRAEPASLCAGLSFCANFAFALVNGVTMLWLGWRKRNWWRVLLPGFIAAAFVTGSVVLQWPRNQFVWGASSLAETARTVISSSLYEVNPMLVNPPLAQFLTRWRFFLIGAVAASVVWELVRTRRRPPEWFVFFSAIGAITIFLHWLLFHLAGVLLPRDRTALYLVPLATLACGAVIHSGQRLSLGGIALYALAIYFVLCLRLNHFKEWKFDADTRATYDALAYYNHCGGITEAATNWRYTAAMNFYRVKSGRETFTPFVTSESYPDGWRAYVLFWPDDRDFIRDRGLQVVYRGPVSDSVVAVPPQVAAASCSAMLPVPR